MIFECFQVGAFFGKILIQFGQAGGMVHANAGFALEDFLFGFEPLNAAARIIDFGGDSVLADGHARASGVDEADRFIRQLAGGDIAMRKPDGGFDGFVEDQDVVMFFERGDDAAHHQDRALSSEGSSTLTT